MGLRRFDLVAHSMGAAVAGHYAGDHPDRVNGLLLVDPAGDNPRLLPELSPVHRRWQIAHGSSNPMRRFMNACPHGWGTELDPPWAKCVGGEVGCARWRR
jgi:pimeloyl-ACP methyl ester carboxylesterase